VDPKDIMFIWGDTPDKIRQETISRFKRGELKIVIGSTIFDAGVNVPVISGVVLAGAGNSDITLIQRIGRGTRNCDYEKILGYTPKFIANNNGKKVSKIYDVLDVNTKFFHKQAKNRYYNASQEFGASRVHVVGGDKSALRKQSKAGKQLAKEVDQFSAQLAMLNEFTK
jgi:superfamily II DNA or RNA helicase